MADMLTSAGQKLLDWHSKQLQPIDPYYETYKNSNGQIKHRRRPLPPGLTHSEKSALRTVRKRAHYLDEGTRIGGSHLFLTSVSAKWHQVLVKTGILVHGRHSIIEVTGDVPDILLCYSLILRIPPTLRHRMLLNYALASSAPNVPYVGSAIASAVKPNSRNAMLFEDFLIRQVFAREKKTPPTSAIATPKKSEKSKTTVVPSTERPVSASRNSTKSLIATTSEKVLIARGRGGGDDVDEAPLAEIVPTTVGLASKKKDAAAARKEKRAERREKKRRDRKTAS